MNKHSFIKLSSLAFVGSLAFVPTDMSAGILNDGAKILKNEMDEVEKRSKFCSAPIYKNIPVLSQTHKAVSNLVGVKSIYQTINDIPSTVANQISDNTYVNQAVTLAIKTPLKLFITNHLSAQGIMRAGVTEVAKKSVARLPDNALTQVPGVVKDIAMDIAMGERPSITGLVYDNLCKTIVVGFIESRMGKNYVKLGNAYTKAIICKVCGPLEDELYRRAKEKIDQAAAKA